MMKRLIPILTIITLVTWVATVFAGIEATPHNFTDTQPDFTLWATYSATDEDELCVFCHTPHGGSLDAPLWNRDTSSISSAGHYTHYTSDTISSVLSSSSGRAVNSSSLACLSCHDGSIGVGDALLNLSGTEPNMPDNDGSVVVAIAGKPVARIGASIANVLSTTDLSDDHPISFSYNAVRAVKTSDFQTDAYLTGQGLTLYSGNVECATCHDPHVDYLADTTLDPFLRISNAGSAMCLSCHIK